MTKNNYYWNMNRICSYFFVCVFVFFSCGDNVGDQQFPKLYQYDRMELESTSFYFLNDLSNAIEESNPSTVKDKFESEIENGDLLELLREIGHIESVELISETSSITRRSIDNVIKETMMTHDINANPLTELAQLFITELTDDQFILYFQLVGLHRVSLPGFPIVPTFSFKREEDNLDVVSTIIQNSNLTPNDSITLTIGKMIYEVR